MRKSTKREINSLQKDLGEASALDAVAVSDGGKKLLDGFITDIIGNMETLCTKVKELSHIEMIGICLDMKNKMDVVKALRNAKANRVFLANELKKKLKEAEDEPEEEEGA